MYAGFVRPAPRPVRPDKWGRFGLGAFLNAGKNGGAFHRLGNGLAANLGQVPGRGVKIGKPFSGNHLAKQNPLGLIYGKERITDRRLGGSLQPHRSRRRLFEDKRALSPHLRR